MWMSHIKYILYPFILFAAKNSLSHTPCCFLTISVNMRKRRCKRCRFIHGSTWRSKSEKLMMKSERMPKGLQNRWKNLTTAREITSFLVRSRFLFRFSFDVCSMRIQPYFGDEYELVINKITCGKKCTRLRQTTQENRRDHAAKEIDVIVFANQRSYGIWKKWLSVLCWSEENKQTQNSTRYDKNAPIHLR